MKQHFLPVFHFGSGAMALICGPKFRWRSSDTADVVGGNLSKLSCRAALSIHCMMKLMNARRPNLQAGLVTQNKLVFCRRW